MRSLISTVIILSAATSAGTAALAKDADAIYFGGPIITIDDKVPAAQAVAIKDGRIVAVGRKAAVLKAERGKATVVHNLKGRALIPGFVDAHGHFAEVAIQAVSANLLPPPDGGISTIPAMQEALRSFIQTSPVVKKHKMVIGMNLDDSQLKEGRKPTRQELDAVSTELPIFVIHQSGHLAMLNSKALTMVGIGPDSVDPKGGAIEREADGKTPNGILQENAFFGILPKVFPPFTLDEVRENWNRAQEIYIANGFTTVQDGKTSVASLKLLPVFAAEKLFKVDIVSYADLELQADNPVLKGPLMSRNYSNRFRIGGVKLTLDGSPQGKTAWFTKPYFVPPAGTGPDYVGYGAFTDAKLREWIDLAYMNRWQLMAHVSGDAAGDQLIGALTAAEQKHGYPDSRTVLIHGHFTRQDQVAQYKKLGVFPALFPMHAFNWGDWHRQSVAGAERAENISPMAWFLKDGGMASVHADAPVVFPNSMKLLDTAVNRTTRTGHVLGPQHRLTPLQALQAMTLWPAYQHFEEAAKGSIKVGKLADLVILSANPLTTPAAQLNAITVDETIKEGRSIYRRAK